MRNPQRLILMAALSWGCWHEAEARGSGPSASAARKPPAVASSKPTAPEPPVVLESVFTRLSPLEITNANSHETRSIRLYDASGRVDEAAAQQLDELLCDARDKDHIATRTIDRRTLQLLFRAAYHFNALEAEVISAYRKPGRHREGLHAQGRAIDFKLAGVKAAELASYLRKQPRVGVGVYTHPKTQYVHLDVRDTSFHWLDGSPPRRRWREQSLGRIPPEHDAAYTRDSDWPEGTTPPSP